jgi:hypothetical protein
VAEIFLEVFTSDHSKLSLTLTQFRPAERVIPNLHSLHLLPIEAHFVQSASHGSQVLVTLLYHWPSTQTVVAPTVELIVRFFLLHPPDTESDTLGSIAQFVLTPGSPKKSYIPAEVIVNKLLFYPPAFKV